MNKGTTDREGKTAINSLNQFTSPEKSNKGKPHQAIYSSNKKIIFNPA